MDDLTREEREQKHLKVKKTIRVFGITLTVIGGGLTIAGLISFFSAFNSMGMPELFWLAFIGLPLLGVGMGMISFSYQREVARYMKNEHAPVVNETAEDVSPAIHTATKTIKDAWSDINSTSSNGAKTHETNNSRKNVKCAKCGAINDENSKFCSECGASLKKVCRHCRNEVECDDKFCNNCGQRL